MQSWNEQGHLLYSTRGLAAMRAFGSGVIPVHMQSWNKQGHLLYGTRALAAMRAFVSGVIPQAGVHARSALPQGRAALGKGRAHQDHTGPAQCRGCRQFPNQTPKPAPPEIRQI